jgi:hypothetical protein
MFILRKRLCGITAELVNSILPAWYIGTTVFKGLKRVLISTSIHVIKISKYISKTVFKYDQLFMKR